MDEEQQAGTEVAEAVAKPRTAPLWHVVLLDDDDHTYAYVIEMLGKLFGHSPETAYGMACEVDATGRVIVETTVFERAEFKQQQIHAYGPDWRLERCAGSMTATLGTGRAVGVRRLTRGSGARGQGYEGSRGQGPRVRGYEGSRVGGRAAKA